MGTDVIDWNTFFGKMQAAGLSLMDGGDRITWEGAMAGESLIVNDIYSYISLQYLQDKSSSDFRHCWNRRIPIKILIFGWLVWRQKILTWDSLIKRGLYAPFAKAMMKQ